MKTSILIFLIIIASTFSCNYKSKKSHRQNEIYKIVFATGGCFGECPLQVFSIDSNLTIKYHGIKYTENKGFYIGKIERALFDTINIKFENVNYKELESIYDGTVDGLSTELYIYYGDKMKHITSPLSDLPDTVQVLYNWLMTKQKKFVLTKTNDSLKFETYIENGPPILETIKFTPPTIDNN
jgi:hypothetical protein